MWFQAVVLMTELRCMMARKFAKIKPAIWRNKKLKKVSTNSKLLALYLMTNEYFGMLGIYRLPRYFMSRDTGLSDEDVVDCMDELINADFCWYDEEPEMVWVIDMALSQVADNPNEKQLIGARKELTRLFTEEDCIYVESFLEKYSDEFRLPKDPYELTY